jgi:hypothetical protein
MGGCSTYKKRGAGTVLRAYAEVDGDKSGSSGNFSYNVLVAEISDPWLIKYYTEMQGIMSAIYGAHPEDAAAIGNAKNAKGKVMARRRVLSRIENDSEVLGVMRAVAAEHDVEVCALMFDGLMTGLTVPDCFAQLMSDGCDP